MQYSIAEAKNHLPQLVHRAEDGVPIELTRRGKPVAVLLSLGDYQRLSDELPGFWDTCLMFREEAGVDRLDIDPESLTDVRDKSPGREVDW